jgi:hypothetical protein
MRAAMCFILIVFLAISFTLLAQAPSESRFLVRLKYIKSDLPLSASTTCIAVFPDSRFHLEQRSGWTGSKPQIYEDSVPDNDLKSLLTIIADPELRDLKGLIQAVWFLGKVSTVKSSGPSYRGEKPLKSYFSIRRRVLSSNLPRRFHSH